MAVYGRNRHYLWNKISFIHWIQTGKKNNLSESKVKNIIPSDFPLNVAVSIFDGFSNQVRGIKM